MIACMALCMWLCDVHVASSSWGGFPSLGCRHMIITTTRCSKQRSNQRLNVWCNVKNVWWKWSRLNAETRSLKSSSPQPHFPCIRLYNGNQKLPTGTHAPVMPDDWHSLTHVLTSQWKHLKDAPSSCLLNSAHRGGGGEEGLKQGRDHHNCNIPKCVSVIYSWKFIQWETEVIWIHFYTWTP
jgi:hypothetical protein